MLGVFTMAITPWSALHHHENEISSQDPNCSHKYHLKSQQETCLVCAAHFEKHYTLSRTHFYVFLKSSPVQHFHPSLSDAFTALIATSLRGPPASV
ncbi:MAG: hypothetical protein REI78_07085 [Pedobacter sp.]|nr:hypothetical protein [Pedobacter sp.]MDQ8052772.1 hypothetical protein [Pedobacter sp.]